MSDYSKYHQQADDCFRNNELKQGLLSLEKAAGLGSIDASNRLATIYFNENEFEKGLIHLKSSAERGDLQASFDLSFYQWLLENNSTGFYNCLESLQKKVPLANELMRLIVSGVNYRFSDVGKENLSKSPQINIYKHYLPELLAKFLQLCLANHLQASTVFNPVLQRHEVNPVRDNDAINFSQVPPFIPFAVIKKFFANLVQLDVRQSEAPMLMRYKQGQKFKPHYDF